MSENYNIIIEEGVDVGRKLSIPLEGARIGRSSKNDISIDDPMLSRHHCRIFYKDGGLWITDLGSANETLLNNVSIDESPIYRGNRITIGDTILKVVDDGRPESSSPPADNTPNGNLFDLGLNKAEQESESPHSKKIGTGPLLTILIVVATLAAGAYIIKSATKPDKAKNPLAVVPIQEKESKTLMVDYEKIEATTENIFYYRLTIKPPNTLSIAIDDLQNNRSVREEKHVDQQLIDDLADFLDQSGFFELRKSYEGVSSGGMNKHTISITIGKKTKTVTVLNRVEPDIFAVVRQKLENFGQVELGIWAIQFSTEKLLKMSKDAYLLGKKLYSERMVSMGNLAAAIKSFKEAAWYLDTVEKKPDFYDDILTSRRQATEELDKKYKEHNFATERAMKLRDWNTAATELRTLLELIPDREDPRNKEARTKLLEVDARNGEH